MKSLAELQALRDRTLNELNLRKERESGIRIVVGMATCGIAAGARPVLEELEKEIKEKNLKDVMVMQTGCIGMCRLEPIVEVYVPGQEKVTYVHMTEDKVSRIVAEHIINNHPVTEYTVGSETK